MRVHAIALNGSQRQSLQATAAAPGVHYGDLEAAVREHLVAVVGHRNRRPSGVELQQAIDLALAEF